MITAILIVLVMLMVAIAGFLYVISVHIALKKGYDREQQEIENTEYEYGHDVHYTIDEHLF